jgi:predicted DNA-binding transcriptional regulator AlpA
MDPAALEQIADAAERLASACREAVRTSKDRLADSRQHEQLSPGMAPERSRYLTQKALAALLDCDVRTLRRWTHEGLVPAPILIGHGAPRWERCIIDAWLEAKAR